MSNISIKSRLPNAQILAHLLSHIFNNNYTVLSVFRYSQRPMTTADGITNLEEQLGELVLRQGGALTLLWEYLWGFEEASPKGKAKASRQEEACAAGQYENDDPDRAWMVETTFRVLLSGAGASTANLFIIGTHLPQLNDFLLTRLFGLGPRRKYDVTFPPRDDWHILKEGEEEAEEQSWTGPSPSLRVVYLSLLRRILESGVTQHLTWRLFRLVNISATEVRNSPNAHNDHEIKSNPMPDERSPSPETPNDTPRPTRKRPKAPHLTISTGPSKPDFATEKLNTEVLDLIRHTMKTRWPPTFIFRGGEMDNEGGLELADMGRPWMSSQKGLHFFVSYSIALR